jgi:nucleotide-binding universal stress UspA family protein
MNILGVGSSLKILLVIDGSPHAAAAVDLLTHLTWPAGTSAEVLVLVPERLPRMGSSPEAPGALDETLQLARWRDWATAKLLATQVANQLQAHHLRVTTEICEGQPAKVALARTTDRAPDLIVIGAKGFSTPGKVRLDPAVYELADGANCSILVAHPSVSVRPLSTILAVDGSPQTWRIVEFLCALSPSNWAKITVVHVSEEKVRISAGRKSINRYLAPGAWPVAQPAILDTPETCTAEEYVTEVVGYLHTYGVQGRRLTCFGHPANEILRAGKQRDAVLIVVGARGQTRAAPFGLGGVAQRVVREAACSVLVVR